MVHELKTLPEYYEAVRLGEKPFEVRKNDRDYKVGDTLHLKEWAAGEYTGRSLMKPATYVLDNPGYCKKRICRYRHGKDCLRRIMNIFKRIRNMLSDEHSRAKRAVYYDDTRDIQYAINRPLTARELQVCWDMTDEQIYTIKTWLKEAKK